MGNETAGGAAQGSAGMRIQHVLLPWAAQERDWLNGTDFLSGYVIWGCGNGSGYENVMRIALVNENENEIEMSYLSETEFWIYRARESKRKINSLIYLHTTVQEFGVDEI